MLCRRMDVWQLKALAAVAIDKLCNRVCGPQHAAHNANQDNQYAKPLPEPTARAYEALAGAYKCELGPARSIAQTTDPPCCRKELEVKHGWDDKL